MVNKCDVHFGSLQYIISAQKKRFAGIVIGLFTEEEGLVMCPPLSRTDRFVKGDRVVVISRNVPENKMATVVKKDAAARKAVRKMLASTNNAKSQPDIQEEEHQPEVSHKPKSESESAAVDEKTPVVEDVGDDDILV